MKEAPSYLGLALLFYLSFFICRNRVLRLFVRSMSVSIPMVVNQHVVAASNCLLSAMIVDKTKAIDANSP
jgi:hypothetical protein